jgi:hypothetical protein
MSCKESSNYKKEVLGKMGVGTTRGNTNYPLKESYATHV